MSHFEPVRDISAAFPKMEILCVKFSNYFFFFFTTTHIRSILQASELDLPGENRISIGKSLRCWY